MSDKSWLVTCCNELGGLLEFNPQTGESEKLLDENCRGIAKYNEYYVLATTSAGLMLLDNKFRVIRAGGRPLLDYHGVAVGGDFAYVVETHRNTIGIFRLPDLEKVREIRLFHEERDVLHMNDLFIVGDRLLISMFSFDSFWRDQNDWPQGA
ncbi:LVIVD repeat-containing protein [Paenibacillus silvisoli]|uniref:hypothetical protein n=1 Tax=Paenibacillus silvisoli TaxID=3110539 RepID=UPI002805FA03|nr:hypothetical protein [Paenibacillus silvisoli]